MSLQEPTASMGKAEPTETKQGPILYTGSKIRKLFGPGSTRRPSALRLYEHDLSQQTYQYLSKQKVLAVDTETGGLDFRNDPLLLVQIATADHKVYMVRRPSKKSKYLIKLLLTDPNPGLIFHHAMFDLRFLQAQLRTILESGKMVDCTKTMMKIARPQKNCGLGRVTQDVVGVKLDKNIEHGHWADEELTPKQLVYAAGDVLYLHDIYDKLEEEIPIEVYSDAMIAITLSSTLQVQGYTDLLVYKKDEYEEVKKNREWWLEQTKDK